MKGETMNFNLSNTISVGSILFLSLALLACSGSDDHAPVSTEPTLNIVEMPWTMENSRLACSASGR